MSREQKVKLAQDLMEQLNSAIHQSRKQSVKDSLEQCKKDLLDILYAGEEHREEPT